MSEGGARGIHQSMTLSIQVCLLPRFLCVKKVRSTHFSLPHFLYPQKKINVQSLTKVNSQVALYNIN